MKNFSCFVDNTILQVLSIRVFANYFCLDNIPYSIYSIALLSKEIALFGIYPWWKD